MRAADGRRRQAFARVALVVGAFLAGAPPRLSADPLVITPQLSVSEQYNDNIFFTKDRVDDFVTSITPGLAVRYRQPQFTAFLSAANSSQLYAKETSENNWASNQFGLLIMSYRATPRLTLAVNDALTRVTATRTGSPSLTAPAPAEPPPSAEQPPTGEPPPAPPPSFGASTLLPRGEVLSNFVSAQATYLISPRWSGGVGYSNGLSDFTDPGGRNLSNSVAGQISYRWRPELSVNGAFSYSRFTLTDEPDSESYAGAVGGAYAFAKTWSLSGSAGVYANRALESDVGGVADGVGPTFSIIATKAFERGSALLGVTQGITSSAGVGGISQTTAAFMQYEQQFTETLNGFAAANYSHFDADPSFDVLVLNVGLSYRVWRFLSAGLLYTYQRSDANQAVSNTLEAGVVDGNVVQLYFTAAYPWQGSL